MDKDNTQYKDMIYAISIVGDNIYVHLWENDARQMAGIPMGTNSAPLNIFLFFILLWIKKMMLWTTNGLVYITVMGFASFHDFLLSFGNVFTVLYLVLVLVFVYFVEQHSNDLLIVVVFLIYGMQLTCHS